MAKIIRAAALAAAIWTAALATALAAPNDGFASFWQSFTVAMAKDDQAALSGMVSLSERLDDATPLTFARFHSDHLGAATRRCLAKAKPLRDVDGTGAVTYTAFCGELNYSFYRIGGAWKLTDIGAN
ncbi:MAG TPA: hypothetical protein VGF50_08800, partial [Caulobacteraceae bacterium]